MSMFIKGEENMILSWVKCSNDVWCALINLNLNHEHFDSMEGVYIIWHGDPNPATVRVGQGIIKDRLLGHRQDPAILAFKNHGLFVTWAKLTASSRDGVERFLAEKLNPKVGARFPDAMPLEVNFPW